MQEGFQRGAGAFGFQKDALGGIVYPAGEAQFGGEAMNKRAESDSLHCTAQDDFEAEKMGRGGFKVSGFRFQAFRRACVGKKYTCCRVGATTSVEEA